MPWNAADASRHKKGLSGKSSSKWASVANSVLAKSGDEGKAIRIANSVTKGAIQRRLKRGSTHG